MDDWAADMDLAPNTANGKMPLAFDKLPSKNILAPKNDSFKKPSAKRIIRVVYSWTEVNFGANINLAPNYNIGANSIILEPKGTVFPSANKKGSTEAAETLSDVKKMKDAAKPATSNETCKMPIRYEVRELPATSAATPAAPNVGVSKGAIPKRNESVWTTIVHKKKASKENLNGKPAINSSARRHMEVMNDVCRSAPAPISAGKGKSLPAVTVSTQRSKT